MRKLHNPMAQTPMTSTCSFPIGFFISTTSVLMGSFMWPSDSVSNLVTFTAEYLTCQRPRPLPSPWHYFSAQSANHLGVDWLHRTTSVLKRQHFFLFTCSDFSFYFSSHSYIILSLFLSLLLPLLSHSQEIILYFFLWCHIDLHLKSCTQQSNKTILAKISDNFSNVKFSCHFFLALSQQYSRMTTSFILKHTPFLILFLFLIQRHVLFLQSLL